VSNKNFDHNDPILGLIDNLTDRIPRWKLDGLGPNSAGGKHLAAWAEHLEVPIDDLKDFLTEVIFVHGESESSWADRAAALMRNAGFRGDDDAVVRGVEMVRGWVKNCAGPRTREDIQAEMATKGLLARAGELVLAIHAVDRAALPHHPNAEIDIVELYRGGDPFERRQLLDPAAWDEVVMPRLAAAKKDLQGFGSRNLHIAAEMRLSMYFAVGRTFPTWVAGSCRRNFVACCGRRSLNVRTPPSRCCATRTWTWAATSLSPSG